jgi:hypothetical protein
MGIELHPKFLSLTGTRCYLPVSQLLPTVAKSLEAMSETRVNTAEKPTGVASLDASTRNSRARKKLSWQNRFAH